MELRQSIRLCLVGVFFIAACALLYLGLAIALLTPGGYHPSQADRIFPLGLIGVSLILCWAILRLLRGSEPGADTKQNLFSFPLILGITFLGAILVSLLIWRQHWVALFWSR